MIFSILVPVYNVEKYLRQCIESIVQQTEKDFELILVNDGSTDASGMICEEYQQRLPDKIKVIHQENKGLLLTRRVSISEAKGQYCIFVDSDDYLRKDALEVIKQTIIQNNADLVIYNCVRVTDEGEAYERVPVFVDGKVFTENDKWQIYTVLVKGNSLNNLVIKAVKRELIDKDNNYHDARHVSNAEDLLQTLPIVTNAKRIVYRGEALYFYRQNSSSITKTFNSSWYDSVMYVNNRLRNYITLWEMDNEYGLDLLRQRYIKLIIEAIRQLTFPSCNIKLAERREYLAKLADDNYFEAYDDYVTFRSVGLIWGIVLTLLRKRQIFLVACITIIKKLL